MYNWRIDMKASIDTCMFVIRIDFLTGNPKEQAAGYITLAIVSQVDGV